MNEDYFSFNKNDLLYNKIIEFVNFVDIKSILDIGCANGFLLSQLHEKIDCFGIDIEESFVNNLKREGYKAKHGSILSIPFDDNSIELVIAKDVIEHVDDNMKALSELIRVSKKYIFISAPASYNDSAWDDFTHKRPYTKKSFEYVAKYYNLSVVEIGSIKRNFLLRLLSKLIRLAIDDICVYAFYQKK